MFLGQDTESRIFEFTEARMLEKVHSWTLFYSNCNI